MKPALLRASLLTLVCLVPLGLASLPAVARAQSTDRSLESAPEASPWSVRGGLGLTAGPETFLMTLEVPWEADETVSLGPLVQMGFTDDEVLFAPTLQVYMHPPLRDDLRKFRPYASLGLGFMYLKKDTNRGNKDEAGFLIAGGVGVEYELTERLWIGTNMLFDFLPERTTREHFVWGWQIVTLRAAF
jgi:hypothetical protein